MTKQGDHDTVLAALRLGWTVSEYRGRGHPAFFANAVELPTSWPDHALPLEEKRSDLELAREAEQVLCALAKSFEVDPVAPAEEHADTNPEPVTCSQRIPQLGASLRHARASNAASEDWAKLAKLIYAWDAAIQDKLSLKTPTHLAAYNLGRALADTYWALDADADGSVASSWTELFGSRRVTLVSGYLGRVSSHFDPLVVPAVSGSFTTWAQVANDRGWRSDTHAARTALRAQTRRWYGLLVAGQNPRTFLKPLAILRNWRSTKAALPVFLPTLALLAIGLGAAATLGELAATGGGHPYLNWILGVLGAVGVSGAAVTARVKTTRPELVDKTPRGCLQRCRRHRSHRRPPSAVAHSQ